MRIGLALGGGGALGFTHIGILKGLQKLQIPIDIIAGTSMGSIVGGTFALTQDAVLTEKIILDVLHKHSKYLSQFKNYGNRNRVGQNQLFFEKAFDFLKDFYIWNIRTVKPYLIDPRPFYVIFKEIFKNNTFQNCKIPFIATAVDIIKGKEFYCREGMLYKISLASSAIPGLFPPMMWQDMLLVDGGALKPLPTEALKEIGKYFIMAVNTENLNYQFTAPKNALDIVFLVDKMRYNHVLSENSQEADLLISPDLSGFTWTDFDCAEKIIAMGEKIILDNAEKLTRLNKINTGKSLKHKVFHFFNSLRSYKKA